MKNIIIAIFIMLVFINCFVSAQVTQEWVATYNGTGTGYNFPKKSAIDKFGNFIVAGNSAGIGGYDYVVLKYSPTGNMIWSKRYNGKENGYDYLTSMVLDDSGNIYVSGVSWNGTMNGSYNWVTIKYDPDGDTLWMRSFDGETHRQDECYDMALDQNNSVYIIGFCQVSSFQYETAMVTVKYNSSGEFQWSRSYFPPLPNRTNWGYSLAIDDSNNVFSSGYGAVPSGNEIVTIKYDTNGNEKWTTKYPTNYGDYLRPTYSSVDNENNLVVVGYSYFSNNYDFVTLKYSGDGDLLWSRYFAGANDDYAKSLFLDSSNNILIGGSSYSIGFSDFLILKYSQTGDTLLIKLLEGGSLNSDQVECIVSDNYQNIYVTGFSQSTSGVEHYLTVKTNSFGDTLWSKIYRNSFSNSAYCLNLDKAGNVFVSGSGGLSGGNSGITTIKYSQFVDVKKNQLNKIDNFEMSNFPNPFNASTVLKYQIKNPGYIEIKIYDILGNVIKTLVNRDQNRGNYETLFDGTNLTSGIYFYSIFLNKNLMRTNRMLLIK